MIPYVSYYCHPHSFLDNVSIIIHPRYVELMEVVCDNTIHLLHKFQTTVDTLQFKNKRQIVSSCYLQSTHILYNTTLPLYSRLFLVTIMFWSILI